ncbi:MAG: hypothetical protein J6Y44_00785 [Clostridia bacterium]|nr:hypothetical protein [Clostridia bacterium]
MRVKKVNKFNLYDLLGKLAAAATKKQEEKPAEKPAPESKAESPDPPPPFTPDKRAVIEMIRRHDKKSREIDERIKAKTEEGSADRIRPLSTE